MQRSVLLSIPVLVLMLLCGPAGMQHLCAQSPVPLEEFEMPAELLSLQSQYSAIPDCMFEYIVHYHPVAKDGPREVRFRFMTARGMWRFDQLDENGLVTRKTCFDGKVCYDFRKKTDPLFTVKDTLMVLPEPLPQRYEASSFVMFSTNPLFAPVDMVFMARPSALKIPDIHAAPLWTEVLRRSMTRHRPPPGTPASQSHFLFDDEALNGTLKMEKCDVAGMPPWRVAGHDYMTRHSRHIVTKYEDWRRFEIAEGTALIMPVLITSKGKGLPAPTSVTTIELLPNTVMKVSGLTIKDFSIPQSVEINVYDLTQAPPEPAVAGKGNSTRPQTTPAKPKSKLGSPGLKPAAELKPAPKLKPAPRL